MLTPEIYAERNTAERQAYLLAQATYEDARLDFKACADAAALKREQAMEPLLIEKKRYEQTTELMAIQINYLEAIAGPCLSEYPAFTRPMDGLYTLSERCLSELYQSYQQALSKAIESMVLDHRNLIKARLFIYKEGVFLKVCEATTTEAVLDFRTNLEDRIAHAYRRWIFPTTSEEAYDYLKNIRALRSQTLDHYSKLLEHQNVILCDYAESHDQRKMFFLESQANNIALIDAQKVYDWCEGGELEPLRAFLAQQNPRQYLLEKAPESLHKSCAKNQLLIVAYLLDLGLTQQQDRYGYYPMHYVCLNEDLRKTALLLDMLIRSPASIDNSIGPHYDTPLHTAAIFSNRTAIRYFMACGADMNDMAIRRCNLSQSTLSYTPLHCAVIAGNAIMVEYLITLGAHAFLMHHEGLSALEEALLRNHTAIVGFLGQKGYCLSVIDYCKLLALMQKREYSESDKEPVITLAKTLFIPGFVYPKTGLQHLPPAKPPRKTKTLTFLFRWGLLHTAGNPDLSATMTRHFAKVKPK
jgi:ankyrin repeat protein